MIFASKLRTPLGRSALRIGLVFNVILSPLAAPADDLTSVSDRDPSKAVKQCISGLQKVKNMPMPKAKAEILGYTVVFNVYWGVASLLRARAALEPQWTNLSRDLDKQLSLTQSLLFPKMRKAWAESINKEAVGHGMTVWVRGGRSEALQIESGQFSTRKSIDEYQKTIRDRLVEMRFKTVEFQAYPNGNVVGYRLDSPLDGNL